MTVDKRSGMEIAYLGFDHIKKFWELYPEPVSILEELVFILSIKLVPVLGSLGMVGLD